MFSLTVFKSIYDNKTHKTIEHKNWNSFEKMLYSMSVVQGHKHKKGEVSKKKESPLISPTRYILGSTRANDNVLYWDRWAAVDIDKHNLTDPKKELAEKIGQYHYVCYSTASSTVEHPKFRLIFPLTDQVIKGNIKAFWYALNKLVDDLNDPQTKDLARLYYVPAKYDGANNFIYTNTGEFINPLALMGKYKYTARDDLPNDVLKKLIEYKEAKLKKQANYSYNWNSYHDCPFINRSLLNEYRVISGSDGSGRYSMIYKLMVSIACSAIKSNYPITPYEIESLIRQIDTDTINRYKKRPILTEAERALSYAYRLA